MNVPPLQAGNSVPRRMMISRGGGRGGAVASSRTLNSNKNSITGMDNKHFGLSKPPQQTCDVRPTEENGRRSARPAPPPAQSTPKRSSMDVRPASPSAQVHARSSSMDMRPAAAQVRSSSMDMRPPQSPDRNSLGMPAVPNRRASDCSDGTDGAVIQSPQVVSDDTTKPPHHTNGNKTNHRGSGRLDISDRSGDSSGPQIYRRATTSCRHLNTRRHTEETRPHGNLVNKMGHLDMSDRSNGSVGQRRATTSSSRNPEWFGKQPNATGQNGDSLRRPPMQRTRSGREDDNNRLKAPAVNKGKDMLYPQGDVTIVYTNVEGSKSMWETCPSDMKKAIDIHDMIMRQCYTNHSGCEVNTEGDAFNLAFQRPVDALAFALQAQLKLYKADWPEGVLKHPDGKEEPALKFKGLRVRFGIHHGPTNCKVHESTGRMIYSGEGVKIAKAVEGMCHGGQILTTLDTWKAVSGTTERSLGRPQILDCGEHLLYETKTSTPGQVNITRHTRRIMQLVPSDLAFDFFEARGRREVQEDRKMTLEMKDSSTVKGRLFPPLLSKRQLTTCFLNAPYEKGRVSICFVYTVGLDEKHRAENQILLAKSIRKQLLGLSPPGYECQEDKGCWMLAFPRMGNAVLFCLQLKAKVQGLEGLVGNVDRGNMFKFGILSGPFRGMGPHKMTGMAEYSGPIVNHASRVASNCCKPGQVCVGIQLPSGVKPDPPDFGSTVEVRLQGVKQLKGVSVDMAIYECS